MKIESVDLLVDVFEEEFAVVKPMLDALRGNGNRKLLENCDDLIIPEIDGALLNTFDHLKAQTLNRQKSVETGDVQENDLVNSAIDMLVKMGASPDIAQPLVVDLINANPEITLIQIINSATTSLSATSSPPEKTTETSKPVYVKRDTWGQLPSQDLRKMFSDKTGTMYEALCEGNVIYPVEKLLAS